jgi:hypothetical protein
MKNKFASIASLTLMIVLFAILGWYWHKAAYPEPDFNICPLCNQTTK